MGGSHTLPRLIGPTLARDLYLTSRSVDAEEALRIGLVSEIAADEECLPRAIARARAIAPGPRIAYGYLTRTLLAAESEPLDRRVEIGAIPQHHCDGHAEPDEGKHAQAGS